MELGFPVDIQSFGLVAFGALAIWSIMTGRLLPKSLVERMLQDKDKNIESRDKTIDALLEHFGKPTEKLLTTLNDQAAEKVGGDGT